LETLAYTWQAIVHWREIAAQVRGFVRSQWRYVAPLPESSRVPLRMGSLSLGLCMVLAFALNDSGIVLPGMAAIMVIPCLVALWLVRLGRDGATTGQRKQSDQPTPEGDGRDSGNGHTPGDGHDPGAQSERLAATTLRS
ncbi:MAG: hypothetical protein Q3979_08100, partial [Actinomycetaceae bacterium]|nr:hypothetical protein [Actinomycetaceae bacterium]